MFLLYWIPPIPHSNAGHPDGRAADGMACRRLQEHALGRSWAPRALGTTPLTSLVVLLRTGLWRHLLP